MTAIVAVTVKYFRNCMVYSRNLIIAMCHWAKRHGTTTVWNNS